MGKKSGETTTTNNNYDPVTSAKMADIAERQQAMAEDQWKLYKDYFQDYEIETATANRALLPYMTESTREQLEYQQDAATANRGLLEPATALIKATLEAEKPVTEKFYKEALGGIDVNRRMDEAETDVKHAVKLGESSRRREASRYGIDPGSTAFANAMNNSALETARMISGSRGKARNDAEQENFARLGLAIGKGTPAPVVGQGGITTVNNADPYARAAGSYSGAASTYAPLATRVLSSTKNVSTGGWDQFFSMLGNAGGQAAGAYTGGKMAGG